MPDLIKVIRSYPADQILRALAYNKEHEAQHLAVVEMDTALSAALLNEARLLRLTARAVSA